MHDKRDEKIMYIERVSIVLIILGVCGIILKSCFIATLGITGVTGVIIVHILRRI